MDKLEQLNYFASPVYVVKKQEFFGDVFAVASDYILKKEIVSGQPRMTESFLHDSRLADFSQYVNQTAWNILSSQGFAMDKLVTYFTEMWAQEYSVYSSMDTHIHGGGNQMSALYFLSAASDGGALVIHDPRPAKVIIGLPEKDGSAITSASNQIVFKPEPGTLVFFNSWLPHSFTKVNQIETGNAILLRFVHMNLAVGVAPETQFNVEII